jgi:hypothetical protein
MGLFAFPMSYVVDYSLRAGIVENPQRVSLGEDDVLEVSGSGDIHFTMFTSQADEATTLLQSNEVVATTSPTLDPSSWQTEGIFHAGTYHIAGPAVAISVSAPAQLKKIEDPTYRRTFATAMSVSVFIYGFINGLYIFFLFPNKRNNDQAIS